MKNDDSDAPHGIELRRHAMRPGARDTRITLFDGEFIDPLEAAGMRVLGQFRDAGDPDLFVRLRGSSDMPARRRGLEAFYARRGERAGMTVGHAAVRPAIKPASTP